MWGGGGGGGPAVEAPPEEEEAGWRRRTLQRPWTPELVKLPAALAAEGEEVEMVAVCDRSGTPVHAVPRATLMQAHREKGESIRMRLEQRREELALAEQTSSFGGSESSFRDSASALSSAASDAPPPEPQIPEAPVGESVYVTHNDLRGNTNFRLRNNPEYGPSDGARGTAYRPNPQHWRLFGYGHADEEVLARAELVNAHQAAVAAYGGWAGWSRRPSVFARSVAVSGHGAAANQGRAATAPGRARRGAPSPQGVSRSMATLSSPLAQDGSHPMTRGEAEQFRRRRKRRPRSVSLTRSRGWRSALASG